MSLSHWEGQGGMEQVLADYTFFSCHITCLQLRPDTVQAQNDNAGKPRRAGRSFQNIHPASPDSSGVDTSKCTRAQEKPQGFSQGHWAGALSPAKPQAPPPLPLVASLLPVLSPTSVAHSLLQSGPVGRCDLILHQRKQGNPSQWVMRC